MPLIKSVIECEHPGGEIVAESSEFYWIRCINCGDLLKISRDAKTKRKLIRGVTEPRYSKRLLDEIRGADDGT